MIVERPLEPKMLVGQRPAALAVVGDKQAQIPVGEQQQQAVHIGRSAAVPDRPHAAVAKVKKAVGVAGAHGFR